MAAGSRTIGGTLRYETILKLASGGMATVYVGTVRGALGFRQLVAIKKPHPHLVGNPEFRRELMAEAQLASMIHHANVVDVRDVEVEKDSISLVMDYIEGASLGELLVAASKGIAAFPPAVAVRIVLDACAGLHAAHELTDDKGRFIGLVHRDVSPQNILVGTDGVARVTDFGIAKIARKQANTEEGQLKGKLAYMAPEYLRGEPIDRRFDVFGMGVVLWEALTGKRLFRGDHEAETLQRVLSYRAPPVSSIVREATPSLDHVVSAAVEKNREDRFQTAAAMGAARETAAREAGLLASHTDVAALVRAAVGADLEERRTLIRARMAMEPAIASVGPVTPGPATERDLQSMGAPPTTLPEAPEAAGAATTRIVGSATQPLTSPVPTMKGQGAATLLSSRDAMPREPAPAPAPAPAHPTPSAPPMSSPARTLSSAPLVMLPSTPAPSAPRREQRAAPTFDDVSARVPVRSNGPLYAGLAGLAALAVGAAIIYLALRGGAPPRSGAGTSSDLRASPSAGSAGAAASASATHAADSAVVPLASVEPAASAVPSSAPSLASSQSKRRPGSAHATATVPTTQTPSTPGSKATSAGAPPPNPYADPARDSH